MLVTEFDAAVLDPSERFGSFRSFALRSHMQTSLHTDQGDDFQARMRLLALGDVVVSTFAYPRLEVVRTPRMIRQGDPEVYEVNLTSVHGGAAQGGRATTFSAGGMVLLDSSRPFRVWLDPGPGALSTVMVRVPYRRLGLPVASVQRLTAAGVPDGGGLGRMFHQWVASLVAHATEFTPATAPALASITADLLGSLLARCLGAEDRLTPESRRQVLDLRIRDFIRRHLHDPALSPATVAAAHQVSLRYVQLLFAERGASPAAWIRQLRLERCRRDLADPGLARMPIHAVAARWGLVDPGQFSRAFRAAYGMTPREHRYLALADVGGPEPAAAAGRQVSAAASGRLAPA